MAEGSSGLITQAPSIDECYYYKPVYPAEVIEEVGFKRERERVVAQERRRRRGPARMPRGLGTGMTTHSWVRPRYLSLVWLRSSRPVAKCGTFFVIVTLTGSWLDTFVMLSTSSVRPLWPFSSLSNFFFLSQVVRGPSLNLFELHSLRRERGVRVPCDFHTSMFASFARWCPSGAKAYHTTANAPARNSPSRSK